MTPQEQRAHPARARVFASVFSDRSDQEPVDVVGQGWLGNARVGPGVHCGVNQEVPTKYTQTQNDGGVSNTEANSNSSRQPELESQQIASDTGSLQTQNLALAAPGRLISDEG